MPPTPRGYAAVIIPVMTQHYPTLQRNLLYTALTRGKRLVVLVGQKKAVAIAVRNISGRRRWSKLPQWFGCCTPPLPYSAADEAKCRHFHTCDKGGSVPANGKPMRPWQPYSRLSLIHDAWPAFDPRSHDHPPPRSHIAGGLHPAVPTDDGAAPTIGALVAA